MKKLGQKLLVDLVISGKVVGSSFAVLPQVSLFRLLYSLFFFLSYCLFAYQFTYQILDT